MLHCVHEVVALRQADGNQLQHGLAHVETRPARLFTRYRQEP